MEVHNIKVVILVLDDVTIVLHHKENENTEWSGRVMICRNIKGNTSKSCNTKCLQNIMYTYGSNYLSQQLLRVSVDDPLGPGSDYSHDRAHYFENCLQWEQLLFFSYA